MMKELFERHYQAIVERGLINNNTNLDDFLEKIYEEFEEVKKCEKDNELIQELIDLAMVCFNCIIHI